MSDGKIYITISDARTGEVIKGTNLTTPKKEKDPEEELQKYIMHEFRNFITSQAKNMVNYSLGNVGNFTGDYNSQRSINYGLSAAGVASNIVMGAVAGAKVGGAYGALIGAGIAATSQIINFGLQMNSQNLEIRKQNYNISQVRQLSGLDGLTNGSRI